MPSGVIDLYMTIYRNYILKSVATIILLVASSLGTYAHESASSIMQHCADKFKNASAIIASFAITDTSQPVIGTLTMSKSRFKMTTPEIFIWYDGKTQWTYIKNDNEVNVTEPTHQELIESNPFEVITNFNSHFKCRKLKSAPGSDTVELTPKQSDAPLSLAKITIDKKSGWPSAITLTFSDSNSISVTITKVTTANSIKDSTFKYDKSAFPTAQIIDLR